MFEFERLCMCMERGWDKRVLALRRERKKKKSAVARRRNRRTVRAEPAE